MTIRSLAAFCGLLALGAVEKPARAAKVDFNREIRPLMSDTCFKCHGFDAASRKGKLRLDERESALGAGKSGKIAIVPGKPEQSEIIKRIFATDEGELMPPSEAHRVFTPAQKELFRRWVAEGAEYQGHWAFEAPARPQTPISQNAKTKTWPKNPIDSFVLERLEKEGLLPSPEADKVTLIRRVSADLTGIPPTPEEVEAFVADKTPQAYEKVVDRLLASPQYGERMAMQWLDYARYADSHGFQSDSSRTMWPWRDWVIKAFNSNKPFDQFTVEQLAGDLLPNATRDQILATAFNRNHRLNGEAGIVTEEWRIENIIDRVDTASQTWMGLTMACARCHDHKYDPISQKDFYAFFSYFNNVPEAGTIVGSSNRSGGDPDPNLAVPTAEQEAELTRLQAAIKTAEARVAEEAKRLPEQMAAWEPTFKAKIGEQKSVWEALSPTKVTSQGGATIKRLDDGSYLASGKNPDRDVYTIEAPLAAGAFGGVLLEALPDPSFEGGGLGRSTNANFVLSKIEAEIRAPNQEKPTEIKFGKAEADYSQKSYEIGYAIKPEANKGWAIDGNVPENRVPRRAMFLPETPVTVPEGATLIVRLRYDAFTQHVIGRFRLSATGLGLAMVKLDGGGGVPQAIKTIVALAPEARNDKQKAELLKFYRANVDNSAKRAEDAVMLAKKAVDDYDKKIPAVMVMREMDKPRVANILLRGEYDKKGPEVTAAIPALFGPLPEGLPNNRLGLAKWLVSPKNPLTARVWVNRQWEKFFGNGIVKSSENLGSQGDVPTHPELLDYLATEFVAQKWDMKSLQKQIVMSATYRQSSKVSPQVQEKDPENRLFARGPRFRLPAELLRDNALAAAGLLVQKIGGPSVRPYMPEGVWDETSVYGDLRGYKPDKGEGLYRRTIYTVWKRTAAPPTLLIFDAPGREACRIRRSITNTPLQALSLLNEVTYVEAARALAQKMLLAGGATPENRVVYGFRRVTGRTPDAEEQKVLLGGLQKRLTRFKADPEAAKKLIAFGMLPSDAKLDPSELAAYTMTANVLLNLDEAVTRE